MSRLHRLLMCPRCGSAPEPGVFTCAGCGRSLAASAGGLNLLDDEAREAADRFAAQYTALRRKEGWTGPDGREDPHGGEPRLWSSRLESMQEVASAMSDLGTRLDHAVVLDIGSGGGWAARYFRGADVMSIDLLDAEARDGVLQVRADMRRLPLRDSTVDVAFYGASLHYADVKESMAEAARILRPGGLVVAVDSPMYPNRRAQGQAEVRSVAYYTRAGFPELASHYHPIEVPSLRAALERGRFEVLRLDAGRAQRWWQRLGGRHRSSFLVARLLPVA